MSQFRSSSHRVSKPQVFVSGSRPNRSKTPQVSNLKRRSGVPTADALANDLLGVLHQGGAYKAAELAFRFGVNSRTVRRKLHFLRDELNHPIQHGQQGFWLDDKTLRAE